MSSAKNDPLPHLFDQSLAAQRATQRPAFGGGADFLIKRAADDLVDRLGTVSRSFTDILDVGTPNGAFADRLVGRDPAAHIRRLLLPGMHPGISETAEARILHPEREPLPVAAHDLVVSGMVLQHANDLPGVLAQIRRTLRPDGLFLGCLLGGGTLKELRDVLTLAEVEVTGGVSPRVFPFADIRDLGGLLQRAGFALPVTDSEPTVVRYDHLFALMQDLRAMAATNVLVGRQRRLTSRAVFARAAALYQERHADADGRIRATFEVIWLSGWAPHASQQKPLKPGSAKARLADALGVLEQRPTGETDQIGEAILSPSSGSLKPSS